MLKLALRRIAALIPTLLIIVTVSFAIIRLAPGGPFDAEQGISPAVRANLERLADADERLRMLTVTSVDTSADLRTATVFVASLAPDVLPGARRFGQPAAPLDIVDRIAYVCLPVAMLLAQGAAVASVGLAVATWTQRVGRAVALSVTGYAFLAFFGPILIEIVPAILL